MAASEFWRSTVIGKCDPYESRGKEIRFALHARQCLLLLRSTMVQIARMDTDHEQRLPQQLVLSISP